MKYFLVIFILCFFYSLNTFSQKSEIISSKKRKVALVQMTSKLPNNILLDTNILMRDLEIYLYRKLDSVKDNYDFELLPFNTKNKKNAYLFTLQIEKNKEVDSLYGKNNENWICINTLLKTPDTTKFKSVDYSFTKYAYSFKDNKYIEYHKNEVSKTFFTIFDKIFMPTSKILVAKNDTSNSLNIIWQDNIFEKGISKKVSRKITNITNNILCQMQKNGKFNFYKQKDIINKQDIKLIIYTKKIKNYYSIVFDFKGEDIILIDENGLTFPKEVKISTNKLDDENFDTLFADIYKIFLKIIFHNR